jgi:hypothetical protein
MTIRNIVSRYDADVSLTRFVDRDMLVHMNLLTARTDQTEYEFFLAACDYLERFDDEVANHGTDFAKIDEVFVV